MDAKTVGKTLGDVEAEALVGTFPDTLSEVVAKTNAETMRGLIENFLDAAGSHSC